MLYFTRKSPCSAVSWLWTIRIWSVSFIVHWCRTSILTFPNSIIGKNRYDQGAILFLQIWCGCDTILVFFVCLRQISIQRESEHWALICSVCMRWKPCEMVSGPVVRSGGEGLSYLAGASWRRQAQGAGKQLPAGGRLVSPSWRSTRLLELALPAAGRARRLRTIHGGQTPAFESSLSCNAPSCQPG